MQTLNPDDIVIVSAVRTPIGAFQGAFNSVPAPVLGAAAIKAALERGSITGESVDTVLFGNVLSAGMGQAPARQAALGAELPLGVRCTTVSKVCGSGMQSMILAHDQLKAGSSELAVAGGMESMTMAPYMLPKARGGLRLGHGEVVDHMFFDGLQNAYDGKLMGDFADENSARDDITREQMDDYTLESLRRATEAIDQGFFKNEIAPVTVSSRKGETVVDTDEIPGNARPEKIPSLRPAFSKDGRVTAANSSSIADGAAALVITTAGKAKELGLQPLAKFTAHAGHAQEPALFTHAPIGAVNALLEKVGWTVDEVDLFEINEAFAMVTLCTMQQAGLAHEKTNVNGGACALGHPIGASGARIVVTLLHALKRLNLHKGVASLCIGGGEATAIAIEIL